MGSEFRALHLFSNCKWTGPADPAIRTACGLRRLGADVVFGQADYRPGMEHMAVELRRNRMPVIGDLLLPKHYTPLVAWRDGKRIAARLTRGEINVLHANLGSDHISASLAKRLAKRSTDRGVGRSVLLVRSVHDPIPPKRDLRGRFAFGNTDGVVVPTESCGELLAKRFRIPDERILVQEPTTDTRRFAGLDRGMRDTWALTDEHVLIGITARIQTHRRFPFLWQVARKVVDRLPQVRFLLLGRGNVRDTAQLVEQPIHALELRDQVIRPGYLSGLDYPRAIKAMDLFMFLVPGSDGSCRAVREAMAAGLPVVTTKRGILPQLVGRRPEGLSPDACGILIDEDVDLMSTAMIKLIENPAARANLSAAALARVALLMDQDRAGRRLIEFYRRLKSLSR